MRDAKPQNHSLDESQNSQHSNQARRNPRNNDHNRPNNGHNYQGFDDLHRDNRDRDGHRRVGGNVQNRNESRLVNTNNEQQRSLPQRNMLNRPRKYRYELVYALLFW